MLKPTKRLGLKLLGKGILLCFILLQTGPVSAAEMSTALQWAGVWGTNRYGHELRLEQVDEFVFGVVEGARVVGIADRYSRTFYGTWYMGSGDGSMGIRSGPVRLTMAPDNKSFTGWWDSPDTVYNGTLTSVAYGKWTTSWDTNYGKVWFQSLGGNVWGGYELKNAAKGQLTGTINGNVLSGTWQEGSEWGLFEFTMDIGGDSFTGWRNTSTNAWNGKLSSSR